MSCRARGCLAVSEWRSKPTIGLDFSVCSSAKLRASVGGLQWAQPLQKSVNMKGAIQQGQKVPLFLVAWLWGACGSPWEDARSPPAVWGDPWGRHGRVATPLGQTARGCMKTYSKTSSNLFLRLRSSWMVIQLSKIFLLLFLIGFL